MNIKLDRLTSLLFLALSDTSRSAGYMSLHPTDKDEFTLHNIWSREDQILKLIKDKYPDLAENYKHLPGLKD